MPIRSSDSNISSACCLVRDIVSFVHGVVILCRTTVHSSGASELLPSWYGGGRNQHFFGIDSIKFLGLLCLRAGSMPAASQNIETKGLTGKMFPRKDLARKVRRVDSGESLCGTFR